MVDWETLPAHMKNLPIDKKFGVPVPWFVDWFDGVPEFRSMDRAKFRQAIKERRCWACGGVLGRWLGFVTGPMCIVTRTSSEPPCHVDCATWSARNCPFLSNPKMVRRSDGLPAEATIENVAGLGLVRNPGVAAVLVTRSYETFPDGKGMLLIQMGVADRVEWWCEGRPATRVEVEYSIETGLPSLLVLARQDGPLGVEALTKEVARTRRYLPAETAVVA